ncbi:amino acid ABC transporter permease [soil metagenome]
MNYDWDFSVVLRSFGMLLEGAVGTLQLAAAALAFAVPLGLLVALLRLAPSRWLAGAMTFYVDFLRTSPMLVLLFWFYFAFPILIGVETDAFLAALLAIGLQSAALFSEVFRGGIVSIARGQREAAKALGLGGASTMRYVILPQAWRRVLPVFFVQVINLIKATSYAATIAYADLAYAATRVASDTYRPIETYLLVGAMYCGAIFLLSQAVRVIEKRQRMN